MSAKLKSAEYILFSLLKEKFKEELANGNIVPSDTINYVLKDDDYFNKKFHEWLVKKGYAEYM